jgi:3-isopropylmalate dehydrogenase
MNLSGGEPAVMAWMPGWPERPGPTAAFVIGVLPGEGIGPEVVGAALTVLEAVRRIYGVEFDLRTSPELAPPGPHGRTLDDAVAEYVQSMLGLGAPLFCGAVSGRFVYELRRRFDLYCKLTPVRPSTALFDASIVRPDRVVDVDLLLVRENVGGLYQGQYGRSDGGRVAYQELRYDADQIDRVLEVSFRAAQSRRGRVTVVTKHGGIPEVSALWRERASAIAEDFAIDAESIEVDNACFQLVADPRRFDVIVAPNMLGDVVADASALLLGSRGMSFSGNFGPNGVAVYQTGHGAAYDLAGTDTANPAGQIFSLAMLLRESFGLVEAAHNVEGAIERVFASGRRSADVATAEHTVLGTQALAEAIADAMVSVSA